MTKGSAIGDSLNEGVAQILHKEAPGGKVKKDWDELCSASRCHYRRVAHCVLLFVKGRRIRK